MKNIFQIIISTRNVILVGAKMVMCSTLQANDYVNTTRSEKQDANSGVKWNETIELSVNEKKLLATQRIAQSDSPKLVKDGKTQLVSTKLKSVKGKFATISVPDG